LTLKEVVGFLDSEFGFRPHQGTVVRWRTKGANGVVLNSIRCGGHRYSSVGHVREFMDRLNNPSETVSTPVMPPRQAEAAALRSAKKLHERLKTRKK
jgi:hypothetical protein